MAALLGRFRRERNGLVVDTMQYCGQRYGLNYGVSLPTVRAIARAERCDHEWAHFLYVQDVRELRLAALWIADPASTTPDELSAWAVGITNSEVAEECALALLSRAPQAVDWGMSWCASDEELLQYAGLLGLSRVPQLDFGRWPEFEPQSVQKPTAESEPPSIFKPLTEIVRRVLTARPQSPLLARGVVALLSAVILDPHSHQEVETLLDSLGEGDSIRYVREEMTWRMER